MCVCGDNGGDFVPGEVDTRAGHFGQQGTLAIERGIVRLGE